MHEFACWRNSLLLPLFRLIWHHRHNASLPHGVPAWQTRHNNLFGVEAAQPMAPMLRGMLFLTSLGRHRQLSGILPYVFLRRTQPTTIPQRPSTRLDLNGQQRSPWCPTPVAATHNSHPVCWNIVGCGGTGSKAPWRPWNDGGRHGWWVDGLASFS